MIGIDRFNTNLARAFYGTSCAFALFGIFCNFILFMTTIKTRFNCNEILTTFRGLAHCAQHAIFSSEYAQSLTLFTKWALFSSRILMFSQLGTLSQLPLLFGFLLEMDSDLCTIIMVYFFSSGWIKKVNNIHLVPTWNGRCNRRRSHFCCWFGPNVICNFIRMASIAK